MFIDWASRNLPDFINIRDIEAVRDRLTSNGMTVGAFVLQLKNISGGLPQVDSTIYTGGDINDLLSSYTESNNVI